MNDKQTLKVSILAGTGGMLEFYDFILYMLFSAQIAKAFFVDIQSPALKSLIVMIVFSIAYIVRPIGGFLIGWMGDSIGRKKSFSFTILLMACCVLLMGIMPTYAMIGVMAPIIFILLRIIQGLALGGELPGAIVFVYESVAKKGPALGILFSMVLGGILLGQIMSIILHAIFGEYAWRAAFISGSIVAFIGFYIRRKLQETEMFRNLESKQKFPLIKLLKSQLRSQVGTILCVVLIGFDGVMAMLYFPKYLTVHLHYPQHFTSIVAIIASFFNLGVIFVASLISDYINYRRLYAISALLLIVIAYPAFYLINSFHFFDVLIGMLLLTLPPAMMCGLFMRIICEAFTTDVRFSGVAIGYNLAFAMVGGLVPVLTELMIQSSGKILGPVIISVCCGVIGLLSMWILGGGGLQNVSYKAVGSKEATQS
ncbi:MFS transporter [Cysteiniphilum halobium]|uniref:MFS transporter n=1 Tax=Cysteiniphilum halobium TaxID=2219059 RepID=UPI000E6482EB|nr:MFS transporter [Cysteiniphilum halobium]